MKGIKTSLITALSIVSVLATGGAAFAANTKVLDSVDSLLKDPPALAEAIVPFADPSLESTALGGVVTVDPTGNDSTVLSVPEGANSVPDDTNLADSDVLVGSTTSVAPAVTTTIAPIPDAAIAPTAGQTTYNIPGVGIVALKYDATSLKIVSVNPVSGWTFKAESTSATRVEIEFESQNHGARFRAELIDGRVIAAVSEDDDGDNDDSESEAKIASDVAEKIAKATYDATVIAIKATYDATERTAKAIYDATERAAKEAFESAETEAKERSDDAALETAKETFETALRTAKETFESTLRTAKETFETALTTAIETLESADD